MNRFVWDLRYSLAAAASSSLSDAELGPVPRGPQAVPGVYRVRLTVDGKSYTQPLKVTLDPRSTATPVDVAKQFDLAAKIGRAYADIAKLRSEITAARPNLSASAAAEADKIIGPAAPGGRRGGGGGGGAEAVASTGLAAVEADLNAADSVVDSSDRTPPATAYALYQQANRMLASLKSQWLSIKK
jgi:hypothetical protein